MFWCVSVFLTKLGPRQECSSSDEIEVTSGEEIWWLNMWSSIRGCEHWKKRTHLLVIISHPHIIILWFMTLNWSLRCILDDSFLLGTLSDVIRGWEKKNVHVHCERDSSSEMCRCPLRFLITMVGVCGSFDSLLELTGSVAALVVTLKTESWHTAVWQNTDEVIGEYLNKKHLRIYVEMVWSVCWQGRSWVISPLIPI